MSNKEVKILWVSIGRQLKEYKDILQSIKEQRLECNGSEPEIKAIYDELLLHIKDVIDKYLERIKNTINDNKE